MGGSDQGDTGEMKQEYALLLEADRLAAREAAF
jgi:hypothetical protein